MERKSFVRVTLTLSILAFLSLLGLIFTYASNNRDNAWIRVVSDECVYDNHNHSAFTSLEEWKGNMIIAFREAGFHRATETDKGKIRILQNSKNSWNPQQTFSVKGEDLRDPSFLLLKNKLFLYTNDYYSEYTERGWTILKSISHDAYYNPYIWKKRVFKNVAYGIGNAYGKWPLLLKSDDGINWKVVCEYKLGGNASEADMVFVEDTMYICFRIDTPVGSNSMWGKSVYPFTDTQWSMMDISVASPEMILYSDNTILLAGREYDFHRKYGKDKINLSLFAVNTEGKVKHKYIVEEQGGDQGYASFRKGKEGLYYMSYYAGMANTAVRMLTFRINDKLMK
jgi:hypothetical protein